mmetsp:Transcript_12976/g.31664  ORF Transcript_12976/g.31664 Transcript_12976/m.31664 type:complete len:388 (-) Transcript_12976:3248-4411(-)
MGGNVGAVAGPPGFEPERSLHGPLGPRRVGPVLRDARLVAVASLVQPVRIRQQHHRFARGGQPELRFRGQLCDGGVLALRPAHDQTRRGGVHPRLLAHGIGRVAAGAGARRQLALGDRRVEAGGALQRDELPHARQLAVHSAERPTAVETVAARLRLHSLVGLHPQLLPHRVLDLRQGSVRGRQRLRDLRVRVRHRGLLPLHPIVRAGGIPRLLPQLRPHRFVALRAQLHAGRLRALRRHACARRKSAVRHRAGAPGIESQPARRVLPTRVDDERSELHAGRQLHVLPRLRPVRQLSLCLESSAVGGADVGAQLPEHGQLSLCSQLRFHDEARGRRVAAVLHEPGQLHLAAVHDRHRQQHFRPGRDHTGLIDEPKVVLQNRIEALCL